MISNCGLRIANLGRHGAERRALEVGGAALRALRLEAKSRRQRTEDCGFRIANCELRIANLGRHRA